MVFWGFAETMFKQRSSFSLQIAMCAILQCDGYHRLSETVKLRWESVTFARGKWVAIIGDSSRAELTKTGESDDTYNFLVFADRHWVNRLFSSFHRALGKPTSGRLFPDITLAKYAKGMADWSQSWNVGFLKLTPHLIRHSGPSDDVLNKLASLTAVKKRGRWARDASVRRYEKSGRSLMQIARLPPAFVAMFSDAHNRIGRAKLTVSALPPPA